MLFSVIIPMYNAEKTIERCLRTVQNQSFSDFEVLIVDDGSADCSFDIASEFAASDSRFSVRRTQRSGTGAARNTGASCAKGDYIIFIDADDYWVDADFLKKLHLKIQENAVDVYMFQMLKVKEDGAVLNRYTKPEYRHANTVLELKDIYQDLVADGQTLASACNKCVRRTLVEENDIRFKEDVLGEDIDWVLQLFSAVRTICLLNEYVYAYTQHRYPSRSRLKEAPNDLTSIICDWRNRLFERETAHKTAVAGLIAFEYGICMGNYHSLTSEKKKDLRRNDFLLEYGLDRKTKLIYKFKSVFGFRLTCFAIRMYLIMRKIW